MTRTYKHGRTAKEWMNDNKEYYKQYLKKYKETHKEQIKQAAKEYYQTHKEQIKKKNKRSKIPYKDWSEERKEKSRERNRKYYQQRRQQRSDYNKRYRWENGEKIAIAKRKHWLTYKYGITPEEYQKILDSQGGVCAICHKNNSQSNKKLFVDHDHKTGKIRGLLCDKCNRALGYFDENIDSMQSAILYLQSSV